MPRLVLSTRGRAAALALAFAPDGNVLAVGSRDAIELIPLRFELLKRSTAELLRQAEQDAGVTLRGMTLHDENSGAGMACRAQSARI